MDFWQVVEQRHSMREFSGEPVSSELLERVLHAASLAPSAMNLQPWRFHIATGATRARVGEVIAQTTVHLAEYIDVMGPEMYESAMKWYSDLGGAPVVVGVSMPVATDEMDMKNTLMSIGAGIENFLLAVTAVGLGACNVTVPQWVHEGVDEVLGMPEDRTVVTVIAVGHPHTPLDHIPPKHTDIADWLD